MTEEERRKKNQELKIKRRDYTGYDDEEFVAGQVGMKRAVLSKYDEVLNGEVESVRIQLFSVGQCTYSICRAFVWEVI